jgi:hypothetical protein
MVGAALGLYVALITMVGNPAGLNPVQIVREYRDPPQPGVDAVMHVELFGRWGYTRTAPRPEDFDTEGMILSLAAPAATVVFGAFCGWWGGVLVGRLARRQREVDEA